MKTNEGAPTRDPRLEAELLQASNKATGTAPEGDFDLLGDEEAAHAPVQKVEPTKKSFVAPIPPPPPPPPSRAALGEESKPRRGRPPMEKAATLAAPARPDPSVDLDLGVRPRDEKEQAAQTIVDGAKAEAKTDAPQMTLFEQQVLGALQTLREENSTLISRIKDLEGQASAVAEMLPGTKVSKARDLDLTSLSEREIENSAEAYFYVRYKPYNKQLGYLRLGGPLPELRDMSGRPMKLRGGTGAIGDIPTWAERVPKLIALKLARYRQDDNNPMTPKLLDILTEEQYLETEARERATRSAAMGLASSGQLINRGPGVLHSETQTFVSSDGGVSATAAAEQGMGRGGHVARTDDITRARVQDMTGGTAAAQGRNDAPRGMVEVQRSNAKMESVIAKTLRGLGGDIQLSDVSMGGRLPD